MMTDPQLRLEIGRFGDTTHIWLDDKPLAIRRLKIVAEAGQKTQVLLDPPPRFEYPTFVDVMDATSVIGTAEGDYILVSSELFENMRRAYERERAKPSF